MKLEIPSTSLDINLNMSERFLKALDPNTDEFTFQIFDDLKSRKNPSLAKTLYGTLTEHANALTTANVRGCGVFVTVNRVLPNCRRTEENVDLIRSFFIDKDDGPLTTEPPAPPSIVVESSHGPHLYYLIDYGIPVLGDSNHKFTEIQKRLAKYMSSDGSVCDLPRVMRLPGFFNMKDPETPVFVQQHLQVTR